MAVSLSFERGTAAHGLRALDPAAARVCWTGNELHLERLDAAGGLEGCLACGHPELYSQRDFPRGLGLAIVVAAALLAPFTYYLSLLAAAAADACIYLVSRTQVVCYRCAARHRGFARHPCHPRFDIGISERLKFGSKAVMGSPMRPGGTAGAPEPEH